MCTPCICIRLHTLLSLWLTRARERNPGICYPLLSFSCYLTSLWQWPPLFSSFLYVPVSPAIWASSSCKSCPEPAAPSTLCSPRPPRPMSHTLEYPKYRVAVLPFTPSLLFHAVLSAPQLVPLLLPLLLCWFSLCIAHKYGSAPWESWTLLSTESPSQVSENGLAPPGLILSRYQGMSCLH